MPEILPTRTDLILDLGKGDELLFSITVAVMDFVAGEEFNIHPNIVDPATLTTDVVRVSNSMEHNRNGSTQFVCMVTLKVKQRPEIVVTGALLETLKQSGWENI